jgi:hypothetical protein
MMPSAHHLAIFSILNRMPQNPIFDKFRQKKVWLKFCHRESWASIGLIYFGEGERRPEE